MKILCKKTPNQSPVFAIFVRYSCEKNMGDVILFGASGVSHRVSNEVRGFECHLGLRFSRVFIRFYHNTISCNI